MRDVGLRLELMREGGEDSNTYFEVAGPGPAKAMLAHEAIGGSLLGQIAPIVAVTLPSEAKEAAGIPSDAVSFAFAYPLACLQGQSDRLLSHMDVGSEESGWLAFMLLGGFCYLSREGQVIRCNALSLVPTASSLTLEGPFRITSPELVPSLRKAGRVETMTIRELSNEGFKEFAWVNPDEKPSGNILHEERQWEYGALVFGNGVWLKVNLGDGSSEVKETQLVEENMKITAAFAAMYGIMAIAEEERKQLQLDLTKFRCQWR